MSQDVRTRHAEPGAREPFDGLDGLDGGPTVAASDVLNHPDTRIASAYRVFGIPAHFFIDRSGILRSIETGGQSPEQMASALTKINR